MAVVFNMPRFCGVFGLVLTFIDIYVKIGLLLINIKEGKDLATLGF